MNTIIQIREKEQKEIEVESFPDVPGRDKQEKGRQTQKRCALFPWVT